MTFGGKLQLLRKQRGLSQEDLSAKLDVSRQAISKWELDASMPDIENVLELSRFFAVSTDYLLKEEETASEEKTDKAPQEQPRHKTAAVVMMLLGGAGILVFWILSAVYPRVATFAQVGPSGEDMPMVVHIGLDAFLRVHNMGLLFALCCITLVLGLLWQFKPQLLRLCRRVKNRHAR